MGGQAGAGTRPTELFGQATEIMEVIPGINEVDFEEVARKFETARGFGAEWVEIDIGDGKFGTVITWEEPERLGELKPPPKVAVHLMVENSDAEAVNWMIEPVKRLLFHAEATREPIRLARMCREREIEPGLAMMAATPWEQIKELIAEFNFFQVLAVPPGRAGQKFDERALVMLACLRQAAPDAKIEVDGGVNLETAPRIITAGATVLVATSFIFGGYNPGAAYQTLKAL